MHSSPNLRPYQQQGVEAIRAAWQSGARRVVYVLPTRGGKTVMFSSVLQQHTGAAVAIAHRQELVGQISLSLARFGIRHQIIGPRDVIKMILDMQREELGRTFYDPSAPVAVAGVDTLIRRDLGNWARQVTLWVMDEAHHIQEENKWCKAIELFPNALGLAVTGTLERADGGGFETVLDTIVPGPSMRELINQGYIADYRIFVPPSDLDTASVPIGSDGDFSSKGLRTAVRRSHIVGDVVQHYQRIAPGLLGITFASDVETAGDMADQYNACGVPAAMICAKTSNYDRTRLIRQFRNRDLLQLVNVDLFGEGFDVPGVEVVSDGRATWSFPRFAQAFARSLTPNPGKTHGIYIDHTGNIRTTSGGRHALPDAPRELTLKPRERGARRERDPDAIPVTTCTSCFRVFEAITATCPWCGARPEPVGRSKPEQVQGDLHELDPAALAALRGEVDRIDGPPRIPEHLQGPAAKALTNRWKERQDAQKTLRDTIALWAGYRKRDGMPDSEIMRRFYWRFGTDIMTAQTLGAREAGDLTTQIWDAMT